MEKPDAFEQVRLILARRRSIGEPFEEAWSMALEAVPSITRNGHALGRRDLTGRCRP